MNTSAKRSGQPMQLRRSKWFYANSVFNVNGFSVRMPNSAASASNGFEAIRADFARVAKSLNESVRKIVDGSEQ